MNKHLINLNLNLKSNLNLKFMFERNNSICFQWLVLLLVLLLGFFSNIYNARANPSNYANQNNIDTTEQLFLRYQRVSLQLKNAQNLTKNITLWLADTPETRSKGLMQIKFLNERGMLFKFETQDNHCFWMKNTPMHLGIIFLDAQKKIVDIQFMKANTLNHHCSVKASLFAIELDAKHLKNLQQQKLIYLGQTLAL